MMRTFFFVFFMAKSELFFAIFLSVCGRKKTERERKRKKARKRRERDWRD